MFKRPDQISSFIDFLEGFIQARISHDAFPSPEGAALINRKREVLEGYLMELSGFKVNQEDPELKCPDCGSDMKLRTNRQNGNKFWGCIKYPNCKGTRDENGLSKEEREEAKYKRDQAQQESGFSFNRDKRSPATEVSPPDWVNPFAKK